MQSQEHDVQCIENVHPTSESIAMPPENPTFLIPLRGAVEVSTDISEREDSPEERVETFLQANSPLFEAVHQAWRDVKLGQNAYKLIVDAFIEENKVDLSREERRTVERYAKDLLTTNVAFGTTKHRASKAYPEVLRNAEIERPPREEHNQSFVQQLQKRYESFCASDQKISIKLEDAPETLKTFITESGRAREVLIIAHLYAQFRQDIALQKIASYLEDNSVVPSFVQRLQALTVENEHSRTYPGMLELLATHVEQEPKDNMLLRAINRSAPKPTTHAREFMAGLYEKQEGIPKELAAALGVLRVTAAMVEERFSYNKDNFIKAFADQAESWATDIPELYARLQVFAASKVVESWLDLRKSLSPFVRIGRLPAEMSHKTLAAPEKPRNFRDANTTPSGPAQKTSEMHVARRGQDHQDITGPEVLSGATPEREPIDSFAVLTALGDKAGRRFRLESVDSIEGLFLFTNMDAYIKEHAGDPSVRPVLEAAIKKLTVDFKDNPWTAFLKGVTYQLEGRLDENSTEERVPSRFSPQHFPGITKGKIASNTRIIYDIVTYEGKRTLVVYGAFIKADVESMSKMPRIR